MFGSIEVPVTCLRNNAYVIAKSMHGKRSLAVLLSVVLAASFVLTNTTATDIVQVDFDGSEADDNIDDWRELLRTESIVIGKIRSYIKTLEAHMVDIKRRTAQMRACNDLAQNDTAKYVYNPLNAVILLKRITHDWHSLREAAGKTFEIQGESEVATNGLVFPDEEELDSALRNLLRIQEVHKTEPKRLAVGEINGMKSGSEMSWSDCLEIGRRLDDDGEFEVARFWIEIALGKLPSMGKSNETQQIERTTMDGRESEPIKAKFEIMESLAVLEFHAGNYKDALDIVNELLESKPTIKRLSDAKQSIEQAMAKKKDTNKNKNKKNQKKKKSMKKGLLPKHKLRKNTKKSNKKDRMKSKTQKTVLNSGMNAEERLITELCQQATAAGSYILLPEDDNNSKHHCVLETANLAELTIQPLKIEYLSHDPFIIIYHDVFGGKQLQDLSELIDEDLEDNTFAFTKMGQKKMRRFDAKLEKITGHAWDDFGEWVLKKQTSDDNLDSDTKNLYSKEVIAHALFELETPKLGGTIVFPQLQLGFKVPRRALVYWDNLNEFREVDYRTKHHLCQVNAGTQITASTTIQRFAAN